MTITKKVRPKASALRAFAMDDLSRPVERDGIAGRHASLSHLADMREEMEAAARAVPYDDATLARWYALQLADVERQAQEVEAKFHRNLDRLKDAELDDPRWPLLWRQQATLAYLTQATEDRALGRGTLPLLREAGHVLVCPTHGIDGDVFAELEPRYYEGLSLRGILEGGLATHASWQRHCLPMCAKGALDGMAAHLQKLWREVPA